MKFQNALHIIRGYIVWWNFLTCACVLSIDVKCILQLGLCPEKFKKHFLDIETCTSCWLLCSEQIYSPTIASILQWELTKSIPTFPPLLSSATSSICYNSKQILSTLLSSHGNLLPALKAQGSSHTLPGESKFLLAPSLQALLLHLLQVLRVCASASLALGGNFHLCRAEVPSRLPQLSILQALPTFHFRLKLSSPTGQGNSPSCESAAFLVQ